MANYNIIHENVIYLDDMFDLSLCDYTKDTVTLISKQNFVVWADQEPTYTAKQLEKMNVCDLIIKPD